MEDKKKLLARTPYIIKIKVVIFNTVSRIIGFFKSLEWRINKISPFLRIFEFLLLILALYLSYLNIKESSKFALNVENHLVKIDTLFQSVEGKIQNIPKAVNKMDSSISNLNATISEQQAEFTNNIKELNVELDNFSESIVEYESLLTNITIASDKQIVLLKETQKKWEAELSRESKLSLILHDIKKLDNDTLFIFFRLCNSGNKFDEHIVITIDIPNGIDFISENWHTSSFDDTLYTTWSYQEIPFIGFSKEENRYVVMGNKFTRFKLYPANKLNSPIRLRYELYSKNSSFEGVLIFSL